MHSPSAKTDRELSLAADEYVWDDAGSPEAHRYLVGPVFAALKSAGVGKVLDLGCGNGAIAAHLVASGYDVSGCDHSASGIEYARARAPGAMLFRHDVSEPLPPEHLGRYDAVVSTEVVEHLPLPRRLMVNARAALRPGGIFVATTPYHGYLKNLALALTNKFDDHWHPLRDYGHVKFFSRRTLTSLFEETGFSDVHYATAGRIPLLACSMVVYGTKPR